MLFWVPQWLNHKNMKLNNLNIKSWRKMIVRMCLILTIDLPQDLMEKILVSLSLLFKWREHNGATGIKRWKVISDACVRFVLIRDTSGFLLCPRRKKRIPPKRFSWIFPLIKLGFRGKLLAVTILCAHRACKATPLISIESINSPMTVRIYQFLKTLWRFYSGAWIFQDVRKFNATLGAGVFGNPLPPNLSEKKGPWSTALFGSEKDLFALFHQPLLAFAVLLEWYYQWHQVAPEQRQPIKDFVAYSLQAVDWWSILKFNLWSRWRGKITRWPHSKLVGLSDRSGKTRVIAICDWWSQTVMKALHDHMFSYLAKLPCDGTFDQDSQRKRVRQQTQRADRKMFSYDLSNATDRLPVILQALCIYLGGFLPLHRAFLWWFIVSRRKFQFYTGRRKADTRQKVVKYAVGQPMGIYSSWSALAFTHHCIIRWCCEINGLDPYTFRDYALLGDDVCIWDEKVAKTYRYVMVYCLGVTINLAKSYEGKSVAEFAKSLYVGGLDLSPVSSELLSLRRAYYFQDIVLLLQQFCDRGVIPSWRQYCSAILHESGPGIPPELVYVVLTSPDNPWNWSQYFKEPFGPWDLYTIGYLRFLQASKRVKSFKADYALGVLQRFEVEFPNVFSEPKLTWHPLRQRVAGLIRDVQQIGYSYPNEFSFSLLEGGTMWSYNAPEELDGVGQYDNLPVDFHPLNFHGYMVDQKTLKTVSPQGDDKLQKLRKELSVSDVIRLSRYFDLPDRLWDWFFLYKGESLPERKISRR